MFQIQKEELVLLFENALRAVPFNVLVAFLLALDLFFQSVPKNYVLIWFFAIFTLSVIRWFYSQFFLKHERYNHAPRLVLIGFFVLLVMTGALWGGAYLLFLPYVSKIHDVIIILILGGMSAGSIGSLSVYLPAYFYYLLTIFLPVIGYNVYTLEPERIILALMFSLFILLLLLNARSNSKLIHQTWNLSKEKDSLIQKLESTNKKLSHSNAQLKVMSTTDGLTGLYNRRYFDKVFVQELNRSRRNAHPLSLIMMDVDNFKYINDTFGHPCGDLFLIHFAYWLRQNMRRTNDTIFRFGGDEFAIILANMTLADTLVMGESLLRQFQSADFAKTSLPYQDILKHVSLSIGIVSVAPSFKVGSGNIIMAADQALYQAKKDGKNKIVSALLE